MNLEKLFNPKSIAIVGASGEEGKVGNVIARNVLKLGYAGKVFFINPNHEKVLGQKCFKKTADIKEAVDLAVVAVPAKFVNDVIKESSPNIRNFVVISAGFAEIGPEGQKREKELMDLAAERKLNILGPNCLGFIMPRQKLNASFAGGMAEAGNVSFVTQSGALAVALMDMAGKENLKFSSIISIGNKMQIDESALLEYLDKDKETKAIGMYLESLKGPMRFLRTAQKVSPKKPIVILKAGRTEKAQKAISSHTGALAGSNSVTAAIFEKAGILQAENLEEFFNLLNLIHQLPAPENDKVAVITNAGGAGVLTTDAFLRKKIILAELENGTKKKLRGFLPEESSVENPVDLLGDAMEDRYEKALEALDAEKGVGTIICVLTPQEQTPVDKIAEKIVEFKRKTKKNIITSFIGGKRVEAAAGILKNNGIPNFSFPERGVETLEKYFKWRNFKDIPFEKENEIDALRKRSVLAIINKAIKEKRKALAFSETKEVMGHYGINAVGFSFGPQEKIEALSFPVAAKIDSDKVLHKTDKQGVILNIKNEGELGLAAEKLRNNFPGENILVQPMLEKQTELIIGLKNDAGNGPAIIYGLGGIYTEIFRTANILVPPLGVEEIKRSLAESRISFLFANTRGQKAYDRNELVEVILKLSTLAQEIPEIRELDINPWLAYNDGRKGVAVDIKIII